MSWEEEIPAGKEKDEVQEGNGVNMITECCMHV